MYTTEHRHATTFFFLFIQQKYGADPLVISLQKTKKKWNHSHTHYPHHHRSHDDDDCHHHHLCEWVYLGEAGFFSRKKKLRESLLWNEKVFVWLRKANKCTYPHLVQLHSAANEYEWIRTSRNKTFEPRMPIVFCAIKLLMPPWGLDVSIYAGDIRIVTDSKPAIRSPENVLEQRISLEEIVKH